MIATTRRQHLLGVVAPKRLQRRPEVLRCDHCSASIEWYSDSYRKTVCGGCDRRVGGAVRSLALAVTERPTARAAWTRLSERDTPAT